MRIRKSRRAPAPDDGRRIRIIAPATTAIISNYTQLLTAVAASITPSTDFQCNIQTKDHFQYCFYFTWSYYKLWQSRQCIISMRKHSILVVRKLFVVLITILINAFTSKPWDKYNWCRIFFNISCAIVMRGWNKMMAFTDDTTGCSPGCGVRYSSLHFRSLELQCVGN